MMFTNWLTSPPQTSSSVVGTMVPANIVTSPPDIVLEVGPTPSTRFMAHSVLLAMHSGYLRSAIRLDENGVQNSSDLPIFLTNVTPEQFAPLLTYMYTGYLDLNIENIFGVLLATHVLHMPRALEICRAFLSRTQSEGYLSSAFLSNQISESNNNNNKNNNNPSLSGTEVNSNNNGVKVIRPIASKPIIPNLGFIVPPMPHISLPSTGTPFRSFNSQHKDMNKYHQHHHHHNHSHKETAENQEDSPPPVHTTSTLTDSIAPIKNISQQSGKDMTTTKKSPKLKKSSTCDSKSKRTTNSDSGSNNHRKETTETENKIIIDVASCDGPVRFRRVLNDAYGRHPQNSDGQNLPHQERSHQSVSISFHQQMAKNISQRQQSEETENSEDMKSNFQQSQGQQQTNGGEVYNCVYCKHTFKSQYCYQKHAKRHLNPLSLETVSSDSIISSGGGDCVPSGGGGGAGSSGGVSAGNGDGIGAGSGPGEGNSGISGINSDSNSKEERILNRPLDGGKREVRPLDMNVQYYPCKTCGSKFPSYYFVHKHRKLCHTNDENSQ